MSETWADAQFDMLEAAYDEVPIEAKARIAELERILDLDKLEIIRLTNEVLKRDELIRDMWAGIVREHPQGGFPDMGLIEKRMRELGIEV